MALAYRPIAAAYRLIERLQPRLVAAILISPMTLFNIVEWGRLLSVVGAAARWEHNGGLRSELRSTKWVTPRIRGDQRDACLDQMTSAAALNCGAADGHLYTA